MEPGEEKAHRGRTSHHNTGDEGPGRDSPLQRTVGAMCLLGQACFRRDMLGGPDRITAAHHAAPREDGGGGRTPNGGARGRPLHAASRRGPPLPYCCCFTASTKHSPAPTRAATGVSAPVSQRHGQLGVRPVGQARSVRWRHSPRLTTGTRPAARRRRDASPRGGAREARPQRRPVEDPRTDATTPPWPVITARIGRGPLTPAP